MRKSLCACAVLLVAVLAAGCGGSGGKGQSAGLTSAGESGGSGSSKTYAELRWGMPIFPNPIYEADNGYYVGPVEQLAVQNIVEFEPNGGTKLGLAESVDQPTPTTYVYHLKKGVKFSDGTPMTAADAVFSLNHNIHGKESFWGTYWEDVASVTAQNASTVVVKLKKPSPIWPEIMAFSSQVIEKAAAEKVGEKRVGTPGALPIGTGPWQLDNYKPEVEVNLSPNPYWKGQQRPANKIKISIFKEESTMALALRSGAIDGAFWYVAEKLFKDIPGTRQLTSSAAANMTFFGMNVHTPPLSDVHVRRAIAYAANVNGMIDALQESGLASEDRALGPTDLLYSGLGSASAVNEMLASLPSYTFNLAAAKRELAKSAYPHGFSTTVQAVAAESSSVLDAEILASNLSKIGIHAKVEELSTDQATSMEGSKVKIYVQEYSSAYPDASMLPGFMLSPTQIKTGGANFASYDNPIVNKLLAEQAETIDQDKRRQILGKVYDIIGSEVPYRPLYTHKTWMSISNKYVYPTFSQWTFNFTPWALDVKLAG